MRTFISQNFVPRLFFPCQLERTKDTQTFVPLQKIFVPRTFVPQWTVVLKKKNPLIYQILGTKDLGTIVRGTKVRETKVRGAKVRGTKFQGAKFQGTKVQRTKILGTHFLLGNKGLVLTSV